MIIHFIYLKIFVILKNINVCSPPGQLLRAKPCQMTCFVRACVSQIYPNVAAVVNQKFPLRILKILQITAHLWLMRSIPSDQKVWFESERSIRSICLAQRCVKSNLFIKLDTRTLGIKCIVDKILNVKNWMGWYLFRTKECDRSSYHFLRTGTKPQVSPAMIKPMCI